MIPGMFSLVLLILGKKQCLLFCSFNYLGSVECRTLMRSTKFFLSSAMPPRLAVEEKTRSVYFMAKKCGFLSAAARCCGANV